MDIAEKEKTLQEGPGLDQLPDDVLWTIMGFLDVGELLKARVVCKQLRRSGAAHIENLDIDCTELRQALTTNFTDFYGLKRVGVSIRRPNQLRAIAQPRLAPLITGVTLTGSVPLRDVSTALAPLMLLPKLRSLCLGPASNVVGLLPVNLEELALREIDQKEASLLTRLSGLTSLEIKRATPPSLGCLAGLASLRSLELGTYWIPSGVFSKFTMLTSLTLRINYVYSEDPLASRFPDLAQLSGLCELAVRTKDAVTRHELACLSHLTKLTRLSMSGCPLDESARGFPVLAPLTNLVSLTIRGDDIGMSLLPHVRVEALRRLTLDRVTTGDLSVLQRATRLTAFCFESYEYGFKYGRVLGSILPKMSGLRSLSLNLVKKHESPGVFQLGPILQALTGLTRLSCGGNYTVGSDLQVIASLPDLRDLQLWKTREVTAACIPALQAMTGLTELDLTQTGIRQEDLTPEVRAAFDVERVRQGRPRLQLYSEE